MRLLAIVMVLLLLLAITACGQSLEDVKEQAEFARVCTEGGGHVVYDMFNNSHCSFLEVNR